MAVTANTPANLVIGAGDVRVDDADLGASKDNNAYRVEQEIYTPDLNGPLGALMGTQYKTREEAFLETTVPEVSGTILPLMWPGAEAATVLDETTIDTDGTRRVPTSAFHDWELRVPGLNGRSFSFFADNAINTENLEFEAGDETEVGPRVAVRSTWDAAALNTSPHRIVVTAAAAS